MTTIKEQQDFDEMTFEIDNTILSTTGVVKLDEDSEKESLVTDIEWVIRQRNFTQEEAAKIMGITQPELSTVTRRKLAGFSAERLLNFSDRLNRHI
jgi:predicted XRE-type DNA-binding protein